MQNTPAHEPRIFDLLDPDNNSIYNMTVDSARDLLRTNDTAGVGGIEGSFALLAADGERVRMARSLDRPMRFFLAKRAAGPALVVADRMDRIQSFLESEGLSNQFQPSYTRMVPAHHVMEISLRGCPDPSPVTTRFFAPDRATLPADLDAIAVRYVEAVMVEVRKWLVMISPRAPIGVAFSGGVDSGSVLLLLHHCLAELGMPRQRLKAFTLAVGGGGADLDQARAFLRESDMEIYGETIEVPTTALDLDRTVRLLEDYKPLDVQASAMLIALLEGIRERYPNWKQMVDGDGGDENLKDYPIEDNPELTIRSVLNNTMLYQEGWGVNSLKHSATYSGGLSRSYVRTYAPAMHFGFSGFSPFTRPGVIAVAEAIPFISLTSWSHDSLYALKGEIMRRGIKALTGLNLPVHPKRRFQDGAVGTAGGAQVRGWTEEICRNAFAAAQRRPAVAAR
jgi:asparagine synthase (glutamine-hydrolysing)